MRKIGLFVLLVWTLVILSACDNDDDVCVPLIIGITSLETEYDCMNTPYQMDIDLSEQFVIIRSQLVFDDIVTGSCNPEIDFNTYDLLIGKKGLSNGFDSINYSELVKDCENGQLSMTITFVLNPTTEAPNVTYHALVPKLDVEETINLTVLTL